MEHWSVLPEVSWLFLYVSRETHLKDGKVKPKSPSKPPPINTALARAVNDGSLQTAPLGQQQPQRQRLLASSSSPSPKSPNSAAQQERDRLFRRKVLTRDCPDHLDPDYVDPCLFLFICVFCGIEQPGGLGQLEAAHVVPLALGERLGKPMDVYPVLPMYLNDVLNGVSLCVACHRMFDAGYLYVEPEPAGERRLLVKVADPVRHHGNKHFKSLHDRPVITPSSKDQFPSLPWWEWRTQTRGGGGQSERQRQIARVCACIRVLLKPAPRFACSNYCFRQLNGGIQTTN